MKVIDLPGHIVSQLFDEAAKFPTIEVCGLVSEKHGIPVRVYPVSNVAANKQCFFEMDPAGQITALKSMRDRSESLFAIYHSHPNAPAQPSPTDIAQASYPEALYLILSLNTEGDMDLQGYHLHHNEVESVELRL